MQIISEEITECNSKLIHAKLEKENKIECEEIAKIINGYNTPQNLQM